MNARNLSYQSSLLLLLRFRPSSVKFQDITAHSETPESVRELTNKGRAVFLLHVVVHVYHPVRQNSDTPQPGAQLDKEHERHGEMVGVVCLTLRHSNVTEAEELST